MYFFCLQVDGLKTRRAYKRGKGGRKGRLISLSVYGILIKLSLQNFRVSSNMEKSVAARKSEN